MANFTVVAADATTPLSPQSDADNPETGGGARAPLFGAVIFSLILGTGIILIYRKKRIAERKKVSTADIIKD